MYISSMSVDSRERTLDCKSLDVSSLDWMRKSLLDGDCISHIWSGFISFVDGWFILLVDGRCISLADGRCNSPVDCWCTSHITSVCITDVGCEGESVLDGEDMGSVSTTSQKPECPLRLDCEGKSLPGCEGKRLLDCWCTSYLDFGCNSYLVCARRSRSSIFTLSGSTMPL